MAPAKIAEFVPHHEVVVNGHGKGSHNKDQANHRHHLELRETADPPTLENAPDR